MIRPPLSYPNELLQFAFFPCKTNYVRMLITAWQSRDFLMSGNSGASNMLQLLFEKEK